MVLGIQVVGIVFGVGMIYLCYLHYKRKEFSAGELFIWMALWIGLIFVALNPNSLDFLVKGILRLKRPLDFFIICGFLFLTLVTFINYSTTKKNNKNLAKVVSRLAMERGRREEQGEKNQTQ